MAAVGALVVLAWSFASDVRWLLQWNTRASELSADARWDELVRHDEGALASWRPWVRLARLLLLPGQMEVQFALHLYMMGANARALAILDEVAPRLAGKPRYLATALATRAIVCGALGRAEQAERDVAALAALPDVPAGLRVAGTQVALWSGRWEVALERAKAVLADEPGEESAHLGASCALVELERGAEALQMADYDPRPTRSIHDPREVKRLEDDDEGRRLLVAQAREREQVTKPSPVLQCAVVHLETGDPGAAIVYLNRAEPVLGSNPVIRANFHFIRAVARASQGDAAGAEQDLQDAARETERAPLHQGLRRELAVARARVMLVTGRPADALAALPAPTADEPRSSTVFAARWRATALEGLGRHEEARAAWAEVLASGMEGRLKRMATEGLARLGTAS